MVSWLQVAALYIFSLFSQYLYLVVGHVCKEAEYMYHDDALLDYLKNGHVVWFNHETHFMYLIR